MIKELIIICILVSILLTSGCIKYGSSAERNETMTKSQIEDQADSMIEQEIENATENISLGDIENSLAS